MLVANSALQQLLGPAPALVAVHLIGLVVVIPLALLVRWPARNPGKVTWPLVLGGLVGVVLVSINNHTFPVLGAGLTVALGVVGQLTASAAVDHFGLFGLPRRAVGLAQVAGLLVASAGVFLMTWGATL